MNYERKAAKYRQKLFNINQTGGAFPGDIVVKQSNKEIIGTITEINGDEYVLNTGKKLNKYTVVDPKNRGYFPEKYRKGPWTLEWIGRDPEDPEDAGGAGSGGVIPENVEQRKPIKHFTYKHSRLTFSLSDIIKTEITEITPDTEGTLFVLESNGTEISFPQRKAVLNFGTSSVKTFGLINCLAIGGLFTNFTGEIKGAFFAHESPTDIDIQLNIIREIKNILDSKNYIITKMVIFKIEPDGASKDMYQFDSKSLNYNDLCEQISIVCKTRFGIKPIIVEYGYYCKRYQDNQDDPKLNLCASATIDPTKDFITTYFGDTYYEKKSFCIIS